MSIYGEYLARLLSKNVGFVNVQKIVSNGTVKSYPPTRCITLVSGKTEF